MPISAHKNFALSTLASPPSGTGGTSLTVATGQGALFPTAPFNVTVWPAGVQPTASNAEVMRVTVKASDTFTVTRAQEGSSARTFAANDQIAATITARTLTDVEYGAHALVNVQNPSYGALGDGTTDDRAAIVLADAETGTLHFPPGTYAIASSLTIARPTSFAYGAKLKPANGVTVTLSGSVAAGLWQIFDCSAGGSVVVDASPYTDIEMNPVWFGAEAGPNGADSTTAMQKCFASGAARIFLPYGDIAVTGNIPLPSAGRVMVRGTGIQSRIIFNPSANDTALFSSTTGDTFDFRDFSVVNNNNGSKTGCVAFDLADADVSDLTFDNVYFNAWNRYCIKLTGGTYVKIDRCRFSSNIAPSGAPAVCIYSTSFINVIEVRATRFLLNDKILYLSGSYNVVFDGACSFEGDGTASSVTLDSMIELATSHGFSFRSNYVEDERPGTGEAFIKLTTVKGYDITGNTFVGQFGGTTNTRRFLYVQGTGNSGRVTSNRFDSCTDEFLYSDGPVIRAHDNEYYQLGTGELTTHNAVMAKMAAPVELNNLLTATTVDVPSISDGAAYNSADVAVTSAALGDQIHVSADADLQGLQLSGYVRAAGQVRFTLVNNTGGAVDLGSATYYIRLIKRDV